MKIVVQNLQKQSGLATQLIATHQPVDIFLAQEVSLKSPDDAELFADAHFTSRAKYGTGIYCRSGVSNVRRVKSPVAEFGGFIYKKTTIADCMGCECVSFHGYNGTPYRDAHSLVLHVLAIIEVLTVGRPCIFGGDFNTWTPEHLRLVTEQLELVGFQHAYSWPYPGRDHPLDHIFLRGVKLVHSECFISSSDHQGAIIEVELSENIASHDV